VTDLDPTEIPAEQRPGWLLDHARGLYADMAAVRLLTATKRFTSDEDFAAACLGAETGADDTVRMWVDWDAVAEWITENGLSSSEIALAQLALAVARREPVRLDQTLQSLDTPTAQRAMAALALLSGSPDLDTHISLWTPPDHRIPPAAMGGKTR
jgi:hypothetical protein